MKIIKTLLHYWFAIVSVLSFLAGWGFLAHSLKPIQSTQTTTTSILSLPALPPIQAFGSGNGMNSSVPNNQSTIVRPWLRSGGS
jgi:hypothetical protein